MTDVRSLPPPLEAMAAPRLTTPAAIGLIGFLTLVDLFAAQAILPSLAKHYGVSASQIGVAANASTLGMAVAGLVAGAFGARLERRRAIWLSLAVLAVPTALLALAPNLAVFAALRVVQGMFMAGAFTLTLAYLAERCSMAAAPGALAAYVTGGVASNLVGRLSAAFVASLVGPEASFLFFATLNLAGAALVAATLNRNRPSHAGGGAPPVFWAAWRAHLAEPRLRRAFAIGFLILFGFIGTFTYVGFVLMAPPLSLGMRALGLDFLVFAPSMVTTPLAGRAARRFGAGRTLFLSLSLALGGLLLMLPRSLTPILAGMVLVGIGTFFAQAAATGYVGRTATTNRAAASGLYLAAYYAGGLAGAAAIGQLFDRFGWNAALAGSFAALAAAALLGLGLKERPA
ncbi:MAG: MFS transporter [Alphaproteobacteria bacterium]|nr:MFS transporter [Alphaproteobacteria bacterium]